MKLKTIDRSEYKTDKGIAQWWPKDGLWHVALPAPDPCPKTGLRTGGFLWTGGGYPTREEAVSAIK